MRRRRFGIMVRMVTVLFLAACAIAWAAGRVLTDRYAWSQPISWVPAPLLAAPVWGACGVVWARWRRRRAERRRRGAGAPVRSSGPAILGGVLWLFTLVTLGHTAFGELGLHRAAVRAVFGAPGARGAGGAAPTRLIFWNQAGVELGDISGRFMPLDPTLFVLANRHSDTRTRDLAQAFIDTGEAHAAVGWPFDLFSRVPIRRWASTSLGLDGRSRKGDGSMREDSGWAAWFEVETDAGPLTVWAIDMPSDPELARFTLARAAGEAIASWQGSVRVIEGEGGAGQQSERAASPGFPAPDVIVGDFNIPRGSASLREFLRASGAGAMRNAFDEGGWGWERTWPRRAPTFAIDQCFVGAGVRAAGFEVTDPGAGGHRALVVEVLRR